TAGSGIPAAGDTLHCGDRLGGGGTSGNSSGVHLHFEIRLNVNRQNYYSGKEVDPFTGPCSTPVSYWTDQGNDRPGTLCSGPVSVPARLRPPEDAFASVRFTDPLSATALLEFGVPSANGDAGQVVAVSIHGSDGRLVARPVQGRLPAGTHSRAWAAHGVPPVIFCFRVAIAVGFRSMITVFKARFFSSPSVPPDRETRSRPGPLPHQSSESPLRAALSWAETVSTLL